MSVCAWKVYVSRGGGHACIRGEQVVRGACMCVPGGGTCACEPLLLWRVAPVPLL